MKLDPIILGHNQFIGVDHFSQDRARSRTQTFSDTHKIVDIIDCFYDLGGRGMMLSTHPKTRDIMEAVGQNSRLAQNMSFYPLIPYAQGYIRKANEKGITGMVTETLSRASTSEKFKIMFRGGINVLRRDFISMLSTLIDVELLPFKGFNVNAIFLHNVLTDLALAFKAQNVFEYYIDHIRENYNVTPAFGTMNFVRLVETFEEWGLEKPTIMTSFNKAGFQMNPSRESCERCLSEYDIGVLAMSTLAAGYLKPEEAYEYLFSLPNIESVVVGISTKEHARETIKLIHSHLEDSLI